LPKALADDWYQQNVESRLTQIIQWQIEAYWIKTAQAEGLRPKRGPLLVHQTSATRFDIVDGNATAQVLMLVGWVVVPVIVTSGSNLEQPK
jgi:hypothetical protein